MTRSESPRPSGAHTYAGLFLVALSTLMLEILLTRIFSVTMLYHFAFVALSVAMFGMTVGALVVFLWPHAFTREQAPLQMASGALAFAVLIVFSFLTQLSIPFRVHPSIVALYAIALTYAVIALPFVASGICVTLALTRAAGSIGRLYAADLAGAALGCILVIVVLGITDAPTAVLVVAALAAAGAWCFAVDARARGLRRLSAVVALALVAGAAAHTVLVWRQFPLLRILYIRGSFEARPLYEKWNSYSRVRVNGDEHTPTLPYGWGLSRTLSPDVRVHQLQMDIDIGAGTVMTKYTGQPGEIEHMKLDVTNVGYYIRPQPRALVIGAGGGRDVLSALAFGAQSVTAVEINKNILDTVNNRFGAFTGHLDRDPRVRFVNDEARSYIARQPEKYDVIQISLIDTWAATAAGAFVLSENSLYTVEAWRIFLERLEDRGILSVSRWYFRDRPGEVYRMTALAATALRQAKVTRVRDHVVIIRNMQLANKPEMPDGVGTLLVSLTPFTAAELDRLDEVSRRLGFEVSLSPRVTGDAVFDALVTAPDPAVVTSAFPIDISAPTDDSPFFFNMLRLRDIFHWRLIEHGKSTHNMKAVLVLGVLLLTVLTLTALCIFVPLALKAGSVPLEESRSLLIFFAAIGLGFMLVETSQMQRLIIVLGHPTYGLSVVLFGLLLSSGIGSFASGRAIVDPARATRALGLLVVVLIALGLVTPSVISHFEASTVPVRIAVAVLLLFPAGFLMGMAFPAGMLLALRQAPELTPWLWGVNGALSVLASVGGICISLAWSISAAYWTGCAAYVLALAAYHAAVRAKLPQLAPAAR